MPLPSRAGTFNAYPDSLGIAMAKDKVTATIHYQLVEELLDDGSADIRDEAFDITGYHYIEKNDGTLNVSTIDQLKTAFGWDGADPFWLQDNEADLKERPVQITVKLEQYQGRTQTKVAWVDVYGAGKNTGGVVKGDDAARQAIANRLGGRMRAMTGGTTMATPAPEGRPKPPTQASSPPSPPAQTSTPASLAESTQQDAWDAFIAACPAGGTQKETEGQWFRILADLFPGKTLADLSPTEWGIVADKAPGMVMPF